MDTAGGHRLIRVNQAARCADPGARRVVSREAGAPRACLWLSLSPPSPFIIGPPVNTPGSRGGHRQGGRSGEDSGGGVGSRCSVIFYTSEAALQTTDKDRQKERTGGGKKQKRGARELTKWKGGSEVTD